MIRDYLDRVMRGDRRRGRDYPDRVLRPDAPPRAEPERPGAIRSYLVRVGILPRPKPPPRSKDDPES